MLVSNNSMNVARVTVIAMNQGLMAARSTRGKESDPDIGSATAWVLMFLIPFLRTPYTYKGNGCLQRIHGCKNKNLFELPGYGGDHFPLEPFRINQRADAMTVNEDRNKPVDAYANRLCGRFHIHIQIFGFRALPHTGAQAIQGALGHGYFSLGCRTGRYLGQEGDSKMVRMAEMEVDNRADGVTQPFQGRPRPIRRAINSTNHLLKRLLADGD